MKTFGQETPDEGNFSSVLEPEISLAEWLEQAAVLREEMAAKYDPMPFSFAELLNKIREERDNQILDNIRNAGHPT